MNIHFRHTPANKSLYPFSQIRDVQDIRVGILTIREKWNLISQKLNITFLEVDNNIVPSLEYAHSLIRNTEPDSSHYRVIQFPWDIFSHNDWAIRNDFELLTHDRRSSVISSTNRIIDPVNVFLEKGVKMEFCTINASMGPVYLGKNAVIMEGASIRGPFAIGENSVIKMGTRIYGATSAGPNCIMGGEIKNTVLFGNSNKAHDGYLGDSVIGEWCNLGAGTSNSNLKNTAGDVRVWNNANNDFDIVGNKCGLIMGDYSRSAINTSFNTGTVVGVSCNVFGSDYPKKWVPDFSWGEEKYILEKAITDIGNWKKLKNADISAEEIEVLTKLYNK